MSRALMRSDGSVTLVGGTWKIEGRWIEIVMVLQSWMWGVLLWCTCQVERRPWKVRLRV
jgi:hypothetical protein